MIIVIILIVLLIFEISGSTQNRRSLRHAREYFGIRKPVLIKYDARNVKGYWTVAVVLSVISVLGLVGGVALVVLADRMDTLLGMVITFSIVGIAVPLALGTWMFYVRGKLYLRSLAKHGYIIPDFKEQYHYAINGLPKAENEKVDDGSIIPAEEAVSNINKESICLAAIAGTVTIILSGLTLKYFATWHLYSKRAWVFYAVITMFWMIGTIVYLIQSNEKLFKDEVEIDDRRLTRSSLGYGIMQSFITIAFTGILFYSAWSITEYEYKSMVAYDKAQLELVRETAQRIYEANKATDQDWDEYDDILKQGVEVMTLEPEDSEFAYELYWTIKDEKDLEFIKRYVHVDGTSYILKLEDGEIKGIYSNELEEAVR